MKKVIALLMILVVISSFTIACSSTVTSGQNTTVTVTQTVTGTTSSGVIQLKFASGEAEAHWHTPQMKAFAADLDKATGGKTQTTVFTGGTLGAGQVLADNVAQGVVDIGFVAARAVSSTYVPAINLIANSVFVTDPAALTYIANDLYERGYFSIQNVKVLMNTPTETGGMFYTKDRQITKFEDFKGLVVGGAAASADFVKVLGGTLVEAPPPEIYSNLEKGVTNAQLVGAGLGMALKLEGVCKYLLWQNTSQDDQMVIMNQAKYDALPGDVKAAILELSRKYTYVITAAAVQNGLDSRAYFESSGITINTLSQSEWQRVLDACAPLRNAAVTDMDAKGLRGTDVLNIALADLAAIGNPTK